MSYRVETVYVQTTLPSWSLSLFFYKRSFSSGLGDRNSSPGPSYSNLSARLYERDHFNSGLHTSRSSECFSRQDPLTSNILLFL